jgi:hypothetical protein
MNTHTWTMILLMTLLVAQATASDQEYEAPPVLVASEVLPSQILESEHHRVADEVVNDGYLNTYRIISDYGELEVRGETLLAIRVWEVDALARLDDLSKTKVFLDAVKQSALGQVTTIVEFSKRPVETVKGIPGGVKRLFKRYRRDAKEGYEKVKEVTAGDKDKQAEDEEAPESDAEEAGEDSSSKAKMEELSKQYFGVGKAEREWAQRLGTDPYTSNEILRKAIEKVAWVDRVGRFGVKLAPIPRIPGVNHVRRLNKVVWSKDPYELRDHNRALLREAGADDELIEAFFENAWLNPTQQTRLVDMVGQLQGVEGRASLIERSLQLGSEVQSRFYISSVAMLVWFHQEQAPVQQVLPGSGVPFVLAGERLLVFAAVDHLAWTEEIAELARQRSDELIESGGASRELWLWGSASERCRQQLAALGWQLHEDLRGQLSERIAKSVKGADQQ